ncbi:MAG: ABC transporter ATP-binding protein [Desulfobacteraceae bacterium]|nr:MAG: ABC transporter ATP-binding protein [Desulfobacteraceae bacterium]
MADLLTTQRLTKNFEGLVAVNQVNFRIQEGQVTGLIGPNGSGKTTLFNLLSGLFTPTEGTVSFLGTDVTRVPPHKRVQMGMARTFQLVSVFDSLTVWENLVLSNIRFKTEQQSLRNFFFASSRRKDIADDCMSSLELVGLESRASSVTSELSYGDKRMLEIAIALSLRPSVLLLDEPLAGLSDHEIGEVVSLIYKVKKNFALGIIEHKISKIVELVDRLCVMNYGRIICEGVPGQVLCDPQVRECYWGKEDNKC